jgi:hypothetical protein
MLHMIFLRFSSTSKVIGEGSNDASFDNILHAITASTLAINISLIYWKIAMLLAGKKVTNAA